VLVDSSVWVNYFKGNTDSDALDILIDKNLILTNDIILAELVPFLKIKRQNKIINLLNEINKLPLQIDWDSLFSVILRI